jgi:hypothetical protein
MCQNVEKTTDPKNEYKSMSYKWSCKFNQLGIGLDMLLSKQQGAVDKQPHQSTKKR